MSKCLSKQFYMENAQNSHFETLITSTPPQSATSVPHPSHPAQSPSPIPVSSHPLSPESVAPETSPTPSADADQPPIRYEISENRRILGDARDCWHSTRVHGGILELSECKSVLLNLLNPQWNLQWPPDSPQAYKNDGIEVSTASFSSHSVFSTVEDYRSQSQLA
ncbi:hypothetical protein GCK72_003812 [Caenorhabditis remanei]|uniref:Uncharacterized protein n=1 Tax=Caenorhabditis remanei TaxID=31234 RepID=A0A6A5HAJ3_CAERE|nr:hypothetical protein GCK72_003812 [Caenorhabditis remanei]KAF1763866.1 hypothetical protein GCK72_003812 [Caenorhabditis remanei]